MGKDAFTNIPNGIPSIEERVNLLYTYGVKRGRLDMDRFVEVASTRAAKLFGLFPKKGTIAVGSDADMVVYDTNYRGVVSVKSQHTNNDYNGFEGMEIEALNGAGRMRPLGTGAPKALSRAIAEWQLGDPTSPRDSWRPWRREVLARRLREISGS